MEDYLPKLPYIVIDQNRCRDTETMQMLVARCKVRGLKLLLPDIAVYEFSNVKVPDVTWRNSLAELCKEPELVVAGRGIGPMMKEELATKSPTEDIVDTDVTPRFQRMLADLRDGNDARLNLALAEIAKCIKKERNLRERHAENKKKVVSYRDVWLKSLSPDDLRMLRQQNQSVFIRVMAELETACIAIKAAENDGCSRDEASFLTFNPSIHGHMVYGLAALSLDWLAYGGLEAAAPEDLTNDIFDLDYVVTATFCQDLATKDKRARRVYSSLISAFEERSKVVATLIP